MNELHALVLAHIADIILNADIMEKQSICVRLGVLAPLVLYWLIDAACFLWMPKEDSSQGISVAAHVAGGFTGIFSGTFVLINYEKQLWENRVKYIFIGIYAAVFITVFVLSVMKFNINNFDEKQG